MIRKLQREAMKDPLKAEDWYQAAAVLGHELLFHSSVGCLACRKAAGLVAPVQTTQPKTIAPAAPRGELLLDGGLCAEGRYLLENGAPLSPGFLFAEHARNCEMCHRGNVAVYSAIEALEAEF